MTDIVNNTTTVSNQAQLRHKFKIENSRAQLGQKIIGALLGHSYGTIFYLELLQLYSTANGNKKLRLKSRQDTKTR